MIRGILMSKEGQKGVLLTKDGSFVKVKLKKDARVSIGQSILESDIAKKPGIAKRLPMAVAACLAAMMVFITTSHFIHNRAIAAYISFDVNPSIEAAVNKDFRIVHVKGMNEDGKSFLEDADKYKNMPLKEFTATIADALSREGYMDNQPDVVISTALTDEVERSNRNRFIQTLNKAVQQFKANPSFQKSNGSLEVIHTTLDQRNKAAKAGVSTGKYVIYLKEGKNNGNIKLSDVKNMTVKELHNKEKGAKKINPVAAEKASKNNGKRNDHNHLQADQRLNENKQNKEMNSIPSNKIERFNALKKNEQKVRQGLSNGDPSIYPFIQKQSEKKPNMKKNMFNQAQPKRLKSNPLQAEKKNKPNQEHHSNKGSDKNDFKRAG